MLKYKTGGKTRGALQAAGEEMKENPPKILAHTREKFGPERAEAQRKAILLNKARAGGARIPRKAKGGMTGPLCC